jgi:hypothetical protein
MDEFFTSRSRVASLLRPFGRCRRAECGESD